MGTFGFPCLLDLKESTFTRVQRLSCCLCLIFLTMVTNAMFFGVGDAGPQMLIRLGNLVVNVTGIIIGIEASLIVIPPSMLVIEIFRRLKPKVVKQIAVSDRPNKTVKGTLMIWKITKNRFERK